MWETKYLALFLVRLVVVGLMFEAAIIGNLCLKYYQKIFSIGILSISQIFVVLLPCIPPALGFKVLQGREEPLAQAGAAAAARESQLPLIRLGFWQLCLTMEWLKAASAQC